MLKDEHFLMYGAGSKAVTCDLGIEATISLSRGVVANDQQITGYLDINRDACEVGVRNYGGKVFTSIEEAVLSNRGLNVIISTPDHLHYEQIMEVMEYDIRGVLSEKPLALNTQEAKQIYGKAVTKGINFEVNYFRRFLPSYIEVMEDIARENYGDFLFGRGMYDKGLMHNGSHLVNLLLFFFKDLEVGEVLKRAESTMAGDPSYSFELKVPAREEGQILIQYGDETKYTVFELELYFSNKVIKIFDFGRKIEFYEPCKDVLPGYMSLRKVCEKVTEYMESSYFSLKSYIENSNYDGLEDAVRTIQICEEISNCYEDSCVCP